jgi:hypothetical protein
MIKRMLVVLALFAAFVAPGYANFDSNAVDDSASRSPFQSVGADGNYGWGGSLSSGAISCDPLWGRELGVPAKLEIEAAKERLFLNKYVNPFSASNQVLASKERLFSNKYENPDSVAHQVQLTRERLWANKYTNPSSAAWQAQAARERLWSRTKAFQVHDFEAGSSAEALWFKSYQDSAFSWKAHQESISESRKARSPWGDEAIEDRFRLWGEQMQGIDESSDVPV